MVFDPTFRDQPVSIDLRNKTLAEALDMLSTSTRNFWRSTGDREIVVVPDTAAKRREYEEEIYRTFYLSNADLKETIDILRIVVDARRIAAMTGTNAITHSRHARAHQRRRQDHLRASTRRGRKSSSTSSCSR